MADTAQLPDMIRRWLPGWVACRGLPEADEVGFALVATLDLPGRYREYFALTDDATALRRLADHVRTDRRPAWLSVPTGRPDEAHAVLEKEGLEVFGEPETFMRVELTNQVAHRPNSPYRVAVARDGEILRAVVTDSHGRAAAEGMIGLSGSDAVAHAIRTDPDHRRRGLGSVVMTALAEAAVDAGAGTGLLIASPAGAQLYRRLGWSPEATVLSARTPG
ncbi:acetyltransferase (GNAT) family protein [Stackebrandtia endophytica]|uniref:Acetyltransferase (GNAT) family protein n=1 Tax=Stackebrandtia endophytica TaxID=1496996 RepID=A0A543B1C6_9ACTN|nr:GNAT family N-acetyltransferase [Stackebrandtia endophytica]TQL78590.1 acetyltransferase (GNAT) family protein [Stackebrandtia endophytica]